MIKSTTPSRYAHIFFMDGVGLGTNDPDVNPFVTAEMPFLTQLLGDNWFVQGNGRIHTEHVSFIPTDANLDMPDRPQSATGQATILTGRNVPQLIGEHYGPKPNQAVRDVLLQGTLFSEVVQANGTAALLTPYPQGYFDGINSGKRLYSSVPFAATSAGLALMTAEDLQNGRAVSPGFTGQGWHDFLGCADIPLLTLEEAGRKIARLASSHTFSFFEHWPSDRAGHRGTIEAARAHLEMIDTAVAGLVEAWDDSRGLLIITSDHGNIENKSHRQHTRNPVPTLVIGPNHAQLAGQIHNLADIAPVVRRFLGIGN